MLIAYIPLTKESQNIPLAQINVADPIVQPFDMKGLQNVFKITVLSTDTNYFDEQIYALRYYSKPMIYLLRDFSKKMVELEFRKVGENIEIICKSSKINAFIMLSVENSDTSPYAPLPNAHNGESETIYHTPPEFDVSNSVTNINGRLVNLSGRAQLTGNSVNTKILTGLPSNGVATPTFVRGSQTGTFYKAYLNGSGDVSTCDLILAEEASSADTFVTYNITIAVNR